MRLTNVRPRHILIARDSLRENRPIYLVWTQNKPLYPELKAELDADYTPVLQVDNARRQGWSWQEIADALGVSKQAVHKKHAGRVPAADCRED